MAKLSWPRANTHSQMMKAAQYDRYARSPSHHSTSEWQAAKIRREIRHLEAKIEDGSGWLKTIATTDPRYPKWLARLDFYRGKRDTLRKLI